MATTDKLVKVSSLKIAYDDLDGKVDDLKSALNDITVDPGDYWAVNLVPVNAFVQGSLNNDGTITSSTTTQVTMEFPVEAGKRYYIANNAEHLFIRNAVVLQTGAQAFVPTATKQFCVAFSMGSVVGGTCRVSFRMKDNSAITPSYSELSTDIYAFEVVYGSVITDLTALTQGYFSFSSQQAASNDKRVSYQFDAEHGTAYSVNAPTGSVIREIILYNSQLTTYYLTDVQTNTSIEWAVIFVPEYLPNPRVQILFANKTSPDNNLSVSDCQSFVLKEVY